MLKNTLLFFCIVLPGGLFAQQENKVAVARYIKFSSADSLLNIKEPVKNQLHQLLKNKKQQPLHLLFTAADKPTNNTISRWLAARQQQDVYRVNLAALVSKYIGETEKNLEQVFSTAEAKNYILIFDEMDDLFGQRSSGNEKETNPALSYFLQRSTAFKGTVIISCSRDNCLNRLARGNFITITTASQ